MAARIASWVSRVRTRGLCSGTLGHGNPGSSRSYTYSAIGDREDMSVNYVSFWDALRFANWLHNG
jgi:hypothetical protein